MSVLNRNAWSLTCAEYCLNHVRPRSGGGSLNQIGWRALTRSDWLPMHVLTGTHRVGVKGVLAWLDYGEVVRHISVSWRQPISRKYVGLFLWSDFQPRAIHSSIHSVLGKVFPLNILFMRIFFFHKGKAMSLAWIFINSEVCGWLRLPSETNHLIKKKWADRIDADHFQCGDMSPQREQ